LVHIIFNCFALSFLNSNFCCPLIYFAAMPIFHIPRLFSG
jgi:hypothetical protein